MARGIVVDHENGTRYAISQNNFNPKVHTMVRELKPGETVIGFTPKRKGALSADEPDIEDYSSKEWTVESLQAEINTRNGQLTAEEQIVPDSNKKADLIAALMLDDEAYAESEAGNSNPE